MIEKEKDLLIKDLCSRMPHGVKVQCGDYLFTFDKDHMGIGMSYKDFNGNPLESPKIFLSGCYYGEDIKPYLRPLSDMTKEELFEVQEILGKNEVEIDDGFLRIVDSKRKTFTYLEILALIDWFYKKHFDIYGLIPKGLAIKAPDGMYN